MEQKISVIVGNRIKEVRLMKKITQEELAEKTDLSVSFVSHIENGRKIASLNTLIKIVNELGVTMNDLLYGIQDNYKCEYQTDINMLLEDCTVSERKLLFEIMSFLKELIRRGL